MKPNIPFSPFKEKDENFPKNPEEMTIEELEILLFSKRLNLKLDIERLHKKINYSKIIMDLVDYLDIPSKIEKMFNLEPQKEEQTQSNSEILTTTGDNQ
jgi:hypothetical protein